MKRTHALFAFVGLTVLLTAGTAQSLSGSNTVFSDDIVDGQVKFADIKPDAVTSSRIRTDAVGASEIRADQVGTSELADNSVGSANIIDGNVGNTDLANNAVGGGNIIDGAVTTSDIADGNVSGADLNFSGNDTIDFDPINVGACLAANLQTSISTSTHTDDAAMVTASSAWPNGLSLHTENFSQVFPTNQSGVRVVACNVTNAQIDPPSVNFDWVIVDTE